LCLKEPDCLPWSKGPRMASLSELTVPFEAIEAAQHVASPDDLISALRPAFHALGVDHFVYGQATTPAGVRAPLPALGVRPEGWAEHYRSAGLLARDAMYPRALRSTGPFTWSGVRETVDKAGVEVLEEARAFGLADGFVVPIHHLNGSTAAVVLSGSRLIRWSHAETLTAHMVAIYFATIGARLIAAPPEAATTLTPRQRECLQWVRAGKTDWEISQILGISEHTVIEHLEQARRRLRVRTRTQAVIEAIVRGLITI
jgi:LuxR family transcriptional regulator, quorum-sensing system regulator BjaR1